MKLTQEEQNKFNEQLFDAIRKEDLAAVKEAVAGGINVNARNQFGNCPLHVINWESDSTEILEFLLESGAKPNAQDKYGRNTALHQLSGREKTKCKAQLLLKFNADMYIKNKYGRTPFAETLYYYNKCNIAELYVLNGYIPTEEDFKAIWHLDDNKKSKAKAYFTELAAKIQVHKAKLTESAELSGEADYCDECLDY